jgi:hypothetical protein
VVFADTGSAFVDAWKLSGSFLVQTLTVFGHHPGIILLYAAPPATERAWVLLRTKPIPAWWLPWLEAFVIVSRLILCAVVVWVALTPLEMVHLQTTLTDSTLVQVELYRLGQSMGTHLRMLTWQIVFFLIVFFLVVWLFGRMSRLWVQGLDLIPVQKDNERLALTVVARNLLLYPVAITYAVVVIRYYLGA